MFNSRRLTHKQKQEFVRREFLTDEFWVSQKKYLDEMLQFRNSVKGKPTEEQLAQLVSNKWMIPISKQILWGLYADDKE
jgi:hypothetical protein